MSTSEYCIGHNRFVACKQLYDETVIAIYEKDSHKAIALPLVRWARLLLKVDSIDEQLERLRNGERAEFQTHIGGRLYASVNYKLKWPMVDLREFYYHPVDGILPTKIGICLHADQWATLKQRIRDLENDHECVRNARCCQTQPDHQNQQMMNYCGECNGFGFDLAFVSPKEFKW